MQLRIILPILLVLLLAACGEKAKPGTPLAARFMAAEFVGKMYNVEPVRVDKEPIVNGDAAHVTALFKEQACDLELVKHPTANQYGWVAKSIQCRKATP